MNLKHSYQYRLQTARKAVLIYYLVVVILCTINLILTKVTEQGQSFFNGIEASSIFFLFVLGLNTFKEDFYMLLQNGVSRKSTFLSILLYLGTLCGIMAAADMLLSVILANSGSYNMLFTSIYYGLVNNRAPLPNGISQYLCSFIWSLSFYFFASSLGLLITLFYYKAGKILRLVVSISVPAFWLIILPAIDLALAPAGSQSFGIFDTIGRFGLYLAGFSPNHSPNPWIGVLSLVTASILVQLGNWCIARRAVIK